MRAALGVRPGKQLAEPWTDCVGDARWNYTPSNVDVLQAYVRAWPLTRGAEAVRAFWVVFRSLLSLGFLEPENSAPNVPATKEQNNSSTLSACARQAWLSVTTAGRSGLPVTSVVSSAFSASSCRTVDTCGVGSRKRSKSVVNTHRSREVYV